MSAVRLTELTGLTGGTRSVNRCKTQGTPFVDARPASLAARRAVVSLDATKSLSKPGHVLNFTHINTSNVSRTQRNRTPFTPKALDAAQPFDFEAKQRQKVEKGKKLKIGIVGFGNFGQFLSKRFIKNGHDVIATSRSDYGHIAESLNVGYFRDPDDFCEMHPDVVIFCTSILSTEATINAFPMQRLRRNTLVADVLSVKQFPKQLFLQRMPDNFDILCLHPMFGPDSGKGSWKDLPLVYDKVRVGEEKTRRERVDRLLSVFADEGCRMVEMSCEEHDIQAASSQFITHTVGRMLGTMELTETTINTKGYESLLSLVNNTYNDSFDLYYGLFMYNKNATAELSRLELAFSQVKAELFDRLHTLIRDDIFDENVSQATGLLSGNGKEIVDSQNGSDSASASDRTFKDRLIDQVNSGGSLGGSMDKEEEGTPSR
tara:strand:+ start:16557 stop:17852 length:1296 start_codon:yes stop_codon:yes gene_type:complete